MKEIELSPDHVSSKGSLTIYVDKMRGLGFTKCQRMGIGCSFNINVDIKFLSLRNEFLINDFLQQILSNLIRELDIDFIGGNVSYVNDDIRGQYCQCQHMSTREG